MNYQIKSWITKIYITFFVLVFAYATIQPFLRYFDPFVNWESWQNTYVALQFAKDNFKNIWISFQITFVGTIVGCCVATLTAYALAVYEFRFKLTIMIFLIIIMMIPFIVNMMPLFLTLKLANEYLGFLAEVPVISYFTQKSFSTLLPMLIPAFGVFVTKQYIESVLNKEMLEAARIEGASEGRIFIKLILPMLAPVIAIIALIQFAGIWNSYELSVFFVGEAQERALAHTVMGNRNVLTFNTSSHAILANIWVVIPIVFLALLSKLILKFIDADLISQD